MGVSQDGIAAAQRWVVIFIIPLLVEEYFWNGYVITASIVCGIAYPFPNFNGTTFEVWEWISNFTLNFTWHVITYACWD